MRRSLVLALLFVVVTAPVQAFQLTGTQSLLVEYGHEGLGALGTIVVDLALAERWHVTYIHDRSWLPGERAQVHDVSVTRVMTHDRTATLGWRVKVPERGETQGTGYVLVAWRWGG